MCLIVLNSFSDFGIKRDLGLLACLFTYVRTCLLIGLYPGFPKLRFKSLWKANNKSIIYIYIYIYIYI